MKCEVNKKKNFILKNNIEVPEHVHISSRPLVELRVQYFANFFAEQSMCGGQLDIVAVQHSARLMHVLTDEVLETDSILEQIGTEIG